MTRFFLRRGAGRSGWALPLLTPLMWLLALPATAQLTTIDQVPTAVQPRWIDLPAEEWARGYNGRQSNFDYLLGTDPNLHNAGFFGQRLRREMTQLGALTPEVELALNRYRRQKKLFLGERVLFVGTIIVAGADIVRNDYSYFNNSEIILSGVAVATLLSNFIISRNTNGHLQRAVKEYQGGLMPQAPRGAVERLRPSFGGVMPQRGGGVGLVVGWQL